MGGDERAGGRILGRLGSAEGKGVVRMQDRLGTGIGDVWSALTDPARLARWYGEVQGDLRPGGEFRVRVLASGWAGTGRVEACEPPRRRPRSMSKTSPPTSPGVRAAMPTRGWTSFFLPIRTWRPTPVRHWLPPD